ncbi:MAG: G5 domain-containing protein [Anaerolineae bacterium]
MDYGSSLTRPLGRLLGLVALLCYLLAAGCTPPPVGPSSYRVTITVDGAQRRLETEASTVGALLSEAGILIGDLDRVTPPEVSPLTDGMSIKIVRVVQSTEVTTQTVPFEQQILRDATVPEGETRLLQSGQTGLLERHYRVTHEDGEEVEHVLIREVMVQEPREEIRLLGTKPQLQNVPITGTLAYLSNQDAWVIQGSSFQSKRLTHFGDLDGRIFELSPDGRKLLFTRATTATDRLNELWLVPTDLASPNPVPLNLNDVIWAGWAPTGSDIAWTTGETVAQAPGWRGQNDLWLATVTSRNTLVSRRKVLEAESGGGYGWWGTRYAWSPDGDVMAFSRPEAVGLINLSGAESETLLTFPAFRTYSSWAWNPSLAWEPKGEFLTSVTHIDDGSGKPEESPVFNLVVLEASGAYSATLAPEVGMWASPSYAPDGRSLLYGRAVVPYQSATSRYTLHLVDRDGSNQRMIYAAKANNGLEIPAWTWSPDGTAIAFVELGDVYLLSLSDEEAVPEALTEGSGVTQIRWR